MGDSEQDRLQVLVVGESWVKHTIHIKGFDQFHTSEYEEGAGVFLDALGASAMDVTYVRAHEIATRFPTAMEELTPFDAVVVSDVGANSFLLPDEVFSRSQRSVNRLRLLSDYVRAGGGLVMVGGYMSFTGIDGRARFGMSPLAEVLPVDMLPHDDRIEVPEGIVPTVAAAGHPAIGDTEGEWPPLLGYNRLIAKGDSTVIARCDEDPLLVVRTVGQGRSVAFASDLAPHWAPPEFLDWTHYRELWSSVVNWAAGRVV